MKQVFVNEIYTQSGGTHGVVVLNEQVLEVLKDIIPEDKFSGLISIMMQKEPFYTLFRYCQFVCLFQFNELGLSLKLTDYHGNLDTALDEYSALKGNGWRKEDTDKIMEIFQEIEINKGDMAELVIK